MKNIRKEKGITLIALVVTIIVLLILATATISAISGENGILSKAEDANKKIDKASNDESYILKEYEEYINKYTAEKVENKVGETITGERAILIDNNDEHIVVPIGFKIKEDSPTEVKDGIVVVAPDGSEFVWVPVKDAIFRDTDENKSKLPTGQTAGTLNGYTYTPMAVNVNGNYKGILYKCDKVGSTGGVYLKYANNTNYQGTEEENENREPYYLPGTHGDAVTGNSTKGIELLKSKVNLSGTDEEKYYLHGKNNYKMTIMKW